MRNYYGPPGQPPNRSFYENDVTLLFPKESYFKTWKSCWIPREKLPQNSMSKENPDPKRMGAIDLNLFRRSSILVLGQTRDRVLEDMNSRIDFLRPNRLILFPNSGEYEFRISYRQSEWVDFRPKRSFLCRSEIGFINVK
ncbi:hypothetical protein LEP1GSC043_1272 [Leptospira weilii str. Ecochallenge]|uniref:Uncharacterized protein n=1 Tax=Leptospira weilii str. Ecochallenge TaxID=1049986 RepID=N1U9U3_9LEPT|nr:hypothetical protein LEP1GSC043_1272 [Leptospira weilii str. Ecochallenge]